MSKTLSSSVICPHIEEFRPEIERWFESLDVWPAAVLVFNTGVAAWFKARAPEIVTMYRRPIADQGPYLAEGEAGGARFVAECSDLGAVKYLLGVNESIGNDRPTRKAIRAGKRAALSAEELQSSVIATNAFYVGFARACLSRGVLPLGPNSSVGMPPDDMVPDLKPCATEILGRDGLLATHSYGPLRLEFDHEWLLHRGPLRWPALLGIPASSIGWVYTEAGWDDVDSSMPSGPWRDLVRGGLLTLADMGTQLTQYAVECRALGVRYAMLFTVGGTDEWRAYDFAREPALLDWLAGHWRSNTAIVPPVVPPADPDIMYVTAHPYANVRYSPRVAAETDIGDVYPGVPVRVLRRLSEWYYVQLDSQAGGARVTVRGYMHISVLGTTNPLA